MNTYEIRQQLDAFVRSKGFKAEDPHYIWGEFRFKTPDGEVLYTDEGLLWCKNCAEETLANALPLLPESERDEHRLCVAGMAASGEDTPAQCFKCHADLDYLLTDWGIRNELEHFEDEPPSGPYVNLAWQIARLLESAEGTEHEEVAKCLGQAMLEKVEVEK